MVYRFGVRVRRDRTWAKAGILLLAVASSSMGAIYANSITAINAQGNHGNNPSQSFQQTVHSSKKSTTQNTSTGSSNSSISTNTSVLSAQGCGLTAPVHQGLGSSSVPELQKLAQYEQVCGGAVASRVMIFTDIPAGSNQAVQAGVDMGKTLKEFARFKINPLVVMEPTINGNPINFQAYKNGSYDGVLSTYFQTLKSQGINDAVMGMWVYFPEANLPEWGPVDLADFAPNVTRTVQLQKNYFPGSQSSIMLDAESYPAGSSDWGNGAYVSLLPFVGGIPKGLIDSFGLQGFPWVPPANVRGGSSLDPSVFLNAPLAQQAAGQLGTSNIWFNTGTFGAMYASSSQQVTMTPSQRQAILSGILAQAKTLQSSGFTVAINLFSEDKSQTGEATNWSYWPAGQASQSPDTPVFVNFVGGASSSHIDIWLYDSQ